LLVILFILRLFAGTATSFFEKVLLNTSQVSPLIITLLILLIIRTLCQLGFNHMKHKKLFLKENLKKTNPKLIGGTIAMIFIIIFVALVCVIQPNIGHQPSTQTKIDACITQSTYTINEDPFLLNLTMHSIPDRNYMNIQLYLNAILERHGDFNKIQVFNNPDKSLEQYYDVTVVRDLGFISIKFYNKDIYKMYNLELLVDENICARSEK
jgi:hypothetical protein